MTLSKSKKKNKNKSKQKHKIQIKTKNILKHKQSIYKILFYISFDSQKILLRAQIILNKTERKLTIKTSILTLSL